MCFSVVRAEFKNILPLWWLWWVSELCISFCCGDRKCFGSFHGIVSDFEILCPFMHQNCSRILAWDPRPRYDEALSGFNSHLKMPFQTILSWKMHNCEVALCCVCLWMFIPLVLTCHRLRNSFAFWTTCCWAHPPEKKKNPQNFFLNEAGTIVSDSYTTSCAAALCEWGVTWCCRVLKGTGSQLVVSVCQHTLVG